MVVLRQLQCHLSPRLLERLLILELVEQVLHTLFIDLYLHLVFLLQVLNLTLLITKLGLLVFEIFLLDDPEVIEFFLLLLGRVCEVTIGWWW